MEIKPLVWLEPDHISDFHRAKSPASPNTISSGSYISIAYVAGKYWPRWDASLPGFKNLDDAKAAGEKAHREAVERFISQWCEVE